MKTAFEAHVNVGLQATAEERVTSRQGTFPCALHQLPVRQRHRGNAGIDAPRDDVGVCPIGVDSGDAGDAGTHSHDFCRAIGAERDCLNCHSYSG
jgi:hypothetical protein